MEDYKTYILSKKEKAEFAALAALALFATAYLCYRSVALCLLSLLAMPVLLKKYAEYMAERRRKELKKEFKDLLYSFSSSFATGRDLSAALKEGLAALSEIYGEKAPLSRELSYMVKGIYESRMKESELLLDFAARSGIEDVADFAEVYATCRATGADTESVVSRTASVLAEKMELEREIGVKTAQKRLEASIISLMPFAVLLVLNLSSSDYVEPLYTSVAGRLVMTAAIACGVFAYAFMQKLTKIEI